MLASTILIATAIAQDDDEVQFPPNPNRAPTPPPAPQEKAIILVVAALGGTTNPEPGTYTYDAYETITLEATPNSGFSFLYWIISGTYTPGHNQPPINYPENIDPEDPDYIPDFPDPSDEAEDTLVTSTNPLTVICGYGYTYVYQPVFVSTTAPPTPTNDAIVVLVGSIGGSTNPGPGTYYYADGSTISLTATPDAGYDFVQWIAVGEDGHATTFTDNPTAITCGYGETFTYQPMFVPTGTTTGEGIPAEYFYAIIIVLVIIAVIGIGAALMYRGKSK